MTLSWELQLDPPATKALELLHKLASDPGIVAIMNKVQLNVFLYLNYSPYIIILFSYIFLSCDNLLLLAFL